MSRYKKYRSDKALREAVTAYFDSISRIRTVMEAYNTGKKDKWGHFVQEWRPVTNAQGETMQEREYVIPPTVGGLCAHLQISRDTWAAYCRREENPQFAETAAWAREQLLSWREKELMTRPGKDVKGLLFDLQANYGIREKPGDAEFGGDEAQIIDLLDIISPAFWGSHHAVNSGKINELVEKGGRGSAKSSYISVELIQLLRKHQDCHAVVLREVGDTLRRSVYAQVCWAISELGLSSKFKCTLKPMECTYLETGQKIMFFGLDDPGKLKSIKVPFGYIGIGWFEELDQFDGPEQVRNVEQSIFRGGSFSFCFKSFNPPAMARNWANKYVRDKEYIRDDRMVHHSTYETTPPEWLGAKFLNDAQHLKENNETAYRHEYLGEVVGSGSAVFENLRMEPITDKQIANFDYHYFGQDWGWYPDPNHFAGCAYEDGVLYIYEEFRGHRQSNAAWAEKIKHHMDDLILADPGSGGDRNVGDFKAYGFRMREAQKGPGSVAYGIKWLQSLEAIVVDPERCPETAKEFSEYEYERDPKTGEVLEGYPDAANHSIDAVRYALEPVWKRRGK